MIVYERFDDSEMPGASADSAVSDNQSEETQPPQDPFEEITPIKKYYLTQRLVDMKNRLFTFNVQRDDLDYLIKFQNDLSYDILVKLSNNLLDNINQDLVRLKNAKK